MTPLSKYSYDIALTVTLKSKHRSIDAEAQFALTRRGILEKLRNCKSTVIAELTRNFDIHYHAILSIPLDKTNGKHPLRYIKDIFRSEYGLTCVKQVDNYEGWIDYLKEDIDETSRVIYPILKDDYDIFEKNTRLVSLD